MAQYTKDQLIHDLRHAMRVYKEAGGEEEDVLSVIEDVYNYDDPDNDEKVED
jgi:hypothetical protein